MLPALLPGAVRVSANLLDGIEDVIARLPDCMDAFAFHLNCTKTLKFPACRVPLVNFLEERGVAVLNAYVSKHVQAMISAPSNRALSAASETQCAANFGWWFTSGKESMPISG